MPRRSSGRKVKRDSNFWLLGYYLSRCGKGGKPPRDLRVEAWHAAYAMLRHALHDTRSEKAFAASMKNARDAFDAYTGASRRGWRDKDRSTPARLPELAQAIVHAWQGRTPEDLQAHVASLFGIAGTGAQRPVASAGRAGDTAKARQKHRTAGARRGPYAVQLATLRVATAPAFGEAEEVRRIAEALRDQLDREPARSQLIAANQPESSSHAVQAAILPVAKGLGFRSEVEGLFAGSIEGLRPDFYRSVGDTGIVLEVERGKTTTNNMDLLDFWKVHICAHASYLFLFVPQELRHNPTMRPKREFDSVQRRLGAFFQERTKTNVRGVYLFGY